MLNLSHSTLAIMLTNRYKNQVDYLAQERLPKNISDTHLVAKAQSFIKELPFDVHKSVSQNWLLQTPKFTLIPEDLYSKGMGKSLLSYTTRLEEGDHIFTDHWDNCGIIIVYAIPKVIIDVLRNEFSGSTFNHGATAFNHLYGLYPQSDTITWLHIDEYEVDFWIASKGNVLFYNKFQYSAEEDILYFMLFALEQNGILPTDVQLRLSGYCLKGDKLYTLLEQYIGEVKEIDLPGEYKTNQKISPREVRQHLNLLGGL